ncbi:DeoR/GlpR family DNA-binding transcription regulator [Thermus tenuipuniceus]|uniref:DeoR/GlpR family DNA-binding transcription regulator n=1 Tax=Thermus tenuipuniceus TaxID=2078690 RepID=UPI000CF89DBB|nr:DeoR/GlpR family DNA-binding transcription regulator [Thermus tenuipuniceus]
MAARSFNRQVLAYLEAAGEARVEEMASGLGVDPTTVRRALRRLSQMGLVERAWGGARLFQAVRYVGEMARNQENGRAAKQAIAAKAAALVRPDARIGISGGTTCTHLARLLRNKPVEVYTNAVNIAVELFSYPKTRVLVLPGELNLFSYELVGPEAVAFAERLEGLDLLFVGASAITPEGFFMRNGPEAEVARALKRKAKEVYVLADTSKWGQQPMARGFFAALNEVTGWIKED